MITANLRVTTPGVEDIDVTIHEDRRLKLSQSHDIVWIDVDDAHELIGAMTEVLDRYKPATAPPPSEETPSDAFETRVQRVTDEAVMVSANPADGFVYALSTQTAVDVGSLVIEEAALRLNAQIVLVGENTNVWKAGTKFYPKSAL